MKIVNFALIVSFLCISQVVLSAELDDFCAYPHASISKFCKKTVGSSIEDAILYCRTEKIMGSSQVQFDWPINTHDFWISSLFGQRTHRGVTKPHMGIDMAAVKGTAVKAAAPGKVIRAEKEGDSSGKGYGNVIEILHKGGFVTRYGHLHDIVVQKGDMVSRGEMIGTVGATGNVRGKGDPSHLHFEIIDKSGQRHNPLKYLYCADVAFAKP